MADNNTHTKTNSGLAIIAVLIAVLALIVAWLAYNRAGEDLEQQVNESIQEVLNSDELNQAADETGETIQEGADEAEQTIEEGPDGVNDGRQ